MDWIEEAQSYLARCYSGVIEPPASLIKRGVEEVRAIRKETVDLKSRISTQEDLISSYISDVWKSTDKIARLEKELGISQENAASYWDRMYKAERTLEGLKRDKDRAEQTIESYRAIVDAYQKTETQKTLRDEFAMAALAGVLANPEGNGRVDVYVKESWEFADRMMEARNK